MTPGFLADAEYAEQLRAGERLIEMHDLAFAFADTATLHLLNDVCRKVALAGEAWIDTQQCLEKRLLEPVARAVRYLQLRKVIELNAAFPHLVRASAEAAERLPLPEGMPR